MLKQDNAHGSHHTHLMTSKRDVLILGFLVKVEVKVK